MTDSHTSIMGREVFSLLFLLYSQFVIQPDLARNPKNSGLLTWDNGGQKNVDEYKISTMQCGGNSLATVHKVHER